MKIEFKGARLEFGFMGHGLTVFSLFTPDRIPPIGLSWGTIFRHGTKVVYETLHCYVVPAYRRSGVMTEIDRRILAEWANVIVTGHGSREGGMAYLKSAGYKLHQDMDTWYLTREMVGLRKPRQRK